MGNWLTFEADQSARLAGAVLALVAAFLYALATVATRKLAGVPPAQIAGLQLLLGVPVLAPLADVASIGAVWQSWSSLLILDTALSALQLFGILLVLVAVVGNQRDWHSPSSRIAAFLQLWGSR